MWLMNAELKVHDGIYVGDRIKMEIVLASKNSISSLSTCNTPSSGGKLKGHVSSYSILLVNNDFMFVSSLDFSFFF